MEMLPLLDDFLLNLQANNYSPETVYNYQRDLKTLEQFLKDSDIDFGRVDKRVILHYKAHLASQDRRPLSTRTSQRRLSSSSQNRMLSSLRSYIKYLLEMDYPSPLPPEAIKLVKTEKRHPQVAELDSLIRVIEAPTLLEKKPKIALRNRAILEILFATGMRISELCSLSRSQIDNSGRIFITGKGRKQRFVYLTHRAQEWLQKYLKTRRDSNPALFISYTGRNARNSNHFISANYIQAQIKHYREELGIGVKISAHSLRHGFATYLAEKGANPAAIQTLLGHESLATTTRYVNPSDKYAEESHHKFHPLA
jgi:site-specific recombinase XerD